MELEEFIKNDDLDKVMNKVGPAADQPIKEELPDQDQDTKMFVHSQMAASQQVQPVFPGNYVYPGQFYQPPHDLGQQPLAMEPKKVITMYPPSIAVPNMTQANMAPAPFQPQSMATGEPVYSLSKDQVERFRSISLSVAKNEMSLEQAANFSGKK